MTKKNSTNCHTFVVELLPQLNTVSLIEVSCLWFVVQNGGKSGQKQVLKCSWREMFVSKLFWFDKNTYKEHVYFRDTSRDRKTINFGQVLVNKEIWDPNRQNWYDGVFVTSHSSDLTDCRWMEHFSISNIPHHSIIQTYEQDFKWYFQQRE